MPDIFRFNNLHSLIHFIWTVLSRLHKKTYFQDFTQVYVINTVAVTSVCGVDSYYIKVVYQSHGVKHVAESL